MRGCAGAPTSIRRMSAPWPNDVLRHRLTLSYEAQGEGVAPDQVVDEILTLVALT